MVLPLQLLNTLLLRTKSLEDSLLMSLYPMYTIKQPHKSHTTTGSCGEQNMLLTYLIKKTLPQFIVGYRQGTWGIFSHSLEIMYTHTHSKNPKKPQSNNSEKLLRVSLGLCCLFKEKSTDSNCLTVLNTAIV